MLCRALFACALLAATAAYAAETDAPVSVMVIGTFHWSNPNRDLHDTTVDDVLAPRRQAEIAALADGLSRFHPTQIMVEWPADVVTQRYADYVKGALKPSHNEVVQLGFRLAKANNAEVHGIDVDGDFPFDTVDTFARAHGQAALMAEADAMIVDEVAKEQAAIDDGTMSSALRWINDPARADRGNGFYRLLLKVGSGTEQPGADLFVAWTKRNALICANLIQLARPGDRIVVIFGSGHETMLRQCVREIPGFRLVEANDYLPQ